MPDNERTLNTKLKFSYDKKDLEALGGEAAKGVNEFKKLERLSEELQKRYGEITEKMLKWWDAAANVKKISEQTRKSTEETIKKLSGTGVVYGLNEKDLRAAIDSYNELRGIVDSVEAEISAAADEQSEITGETERTLDAQKQIVKETNAYARQTQLASSAASRMRGIAEGLNYTAQSLTLAGAAISGPILLSMRSYVNYAGMAQETSREWQEQMGKIETAQRRIGQAGAQTVLPYLEQAAEIMERLSGYVQQNPETVGNILKAGVGMTAIGGLMMAMNRGIRLYVDYKYITASAASVTAAKMQIEASKNMLTAAGIQSTASKGMAAGGGFNWKGLLAGGAVVAIIAATVMALRELYKGALPAGEEAFEKAGVDMDKIYPGVANLYKDRRDAESGARPDPIQQFMDKLNEKLEKLGFTADETAGELEKADIASQANVERYIAYRQAEAQAAEQYEEQRTEILDRYGQERVRLEEEYESERSSIIQEYEENALQALQDFNEQLAQAARDFDKAEARYEEDYYAKRTEASRKHNQDIQRAEQDHQKRLRELRRDHEDRLENLVASRDALGIVREMRNYERQRQEENESFQEKIAQQNEQYAQELRDMESNFRTQRARRLEDYQQRIADQTAEFQQQQQQEREQHEERLKELDKRHEDEMTALKENKDEELTLLKSEFYKQKQARARALADEYRLMAVHLGYQSKAVSDWWQGMTDGFYDFFNGISDMASDLPGFNAPAQMNAPQYQYDPGITGYTGSNNSLWDPAYGAPGMASGGYVGSGLYWMGEKGREFVLDNMSTKAAESLLGGGGLTQGKVIAGLLSASKAGGKGKAQITLNQNFSFHGSFSEAERNWIRRTARESGKAGVTEALNAISDRHDFGWSGNA